MSIQIRKEKEKLEMRRKIFDAATNIILEQGYEKLSMRKLAERIEYSPTILYHYFRDKADIVEQIVLENYRTCIRAIEDALEGHKEESAQVRFRCAAVCFVTTMTANAPQFRAVLLSGGDMAIPDPEGGETGLDILGRILQDGVREGTLHSVTPHTAQIMVSALFGLVFHLVSHKIEEKSQIEKMARECVELFLKGCMVER